MIDYIKLMLGDCASNFSDELISLMLQQAENEILMYCNMKPEQLDCELEHVATRMAVVKLNRLHTEGLSSQGYSGTNESYVNGYPADIMNILKRKRKIKLL